MVKTGQLVIREFIAVDATGLPVDATVGPTGTLVLNGADNGAVVTIAHPATGRYTWSVTMPALAAGDSVDMRIAATVGGIATEGIVWQDTADKYTADLVDAAAAPAMITGQQVRDAMKLNASAGAPVAGSVDKHLDDILAGIGLVPGSVEFIYTATDSVTLLPLDNVNVWVTTDIAGTNVIASGYTDLFGRITFWLDPGTYYFWRALGGYVWTNPDTETVV